MPAAKLEWIQALRGIAALMVLGFHLAPQWELAGLGAFTAALRWGFTGVDLFFALSGFVVFRALQLVVRPAEVHRFVRQRLLRIYLGYWPALLLVALFSTLVMGQPLPSWEVLFFSLSLWSPDLNHHWLPVAWSLSFELYFYGGLLLLVLANRRRPTVAVALAVLVLVAWNVVGAMLNPRLALEGTQPLRYLLTPFGIEFLLGALLSPVYDLAERQGWRAEAALPVAAALALLSFAAGTGAAWYTSMEILRAATFGMAAVFTLAFVLGLQLAGAQAPNWLCRIGDASYGLYLLHPMLLDACSLVYDALARAGAGTAAFVAYALLVPVVVVLIALAWFRWVEQPLLHAALARWAPRQPTGPARTGPAPG